MSQENAKPGGQGQNETKALPEAAPATPEAKKSGELTDQALGTVAGGLMTSVLTNIANMKHESLKGIAQNLRG